MTTTDQPEPTVDFETLFESEDLRELLEAAEATSSIKSAELIEILEAHAFDSIEAQPVARDLSQIPQNTTRAPCLLVRAVYRVLP
jgi:hypothetical protein